MVLDGCHFEYGSFISRKHDLVFVHLDTSIDTRLSGELSPQYLFNKRNRVRYVIGDDYSNSAFELEVEITTADSRPLAPSEQRVITKELFNRHGYKKLYVDMADDYLAETYRYVDSKLKRSYLNCRFLNPSAIEDGIGRVIGYRCLMTCDSRMLWEDPTERIYLTGNTSAEDSTTLQISVDSDPDEYLYPTVRIQTGSAGGDFTITNQTDDASRVTRFVGVAPGSTITMKSDICFVSADHYDSFVGGNFIRLLDGENRLEITGDVRSLSVVYAARRFL